MTALADLTDSAIIFAGRVQVECERNESGTCTLRIGDDDEAVRIIGTVRHLSDMMNDVLRAFSDAIISGHEAVNDDR